MMNSLNAVVRGEAEETNDFPQKIIHSELTI